MGRRDGESECESMGGEGIRSVCEEGRGERGLFLFMTIS